MKEWGYELILDCHGIDKKKITRPSIKEYFIQLCKQIDMIRVFEPIFWDEENDKSPYPKNLKGITAIQLIKTSNITCHFGFRGHAYINIFTCKPFDPKKAAEFTKKYFDVKTMTSRFLKRI